MKNIFFTILLISCCLINGGSIYPQEEEVMFCDFESGEDGWEVPDWAFQQQDYVCKSIRTTDKHKSHGNKSLAVDVDFSGKGFCSSIIEKKGDISLEGYKSLVCDIFMTGMSRRGIRVRFVLHVGKNWEWTEEYEPILLKSGEWVTLEVDLSDQSMWKQLKILERKDDKGKTISSSYRYVKTFLTEEMKKEVRTLGIRIESDSIRYKGTICIDNMYLVKDSF